jgi:hypothetical protein
LPFCNFKKTKVKTQTSNRMILMQSLTSIGS